MEEKEPRLQFLLSVMDQKGISKLALARLMGVSPQNIFTYFKRDDMKLSYAQEIFRRLGYGLSFRLESEVNPPKDVFIEIEDLVGKDGLNRLAFLRMAMGRFGIQRTSRHPRPL